MAFGISVRLTHTGTTKGSLLITDIEDGSDTNPLFRRDGRCYIPAPVNGVATPVDLVYSTNVARSFEGGVIRKFVQQGLLTATMAMGQSVPMTPVRIPIVIAPNTNIEEIYIASQPQTLRGLTLLIRSAATTTGDYLLTVSKNGAPITTYDLKTLQANTPVTIPLNEELNSNDILMMSATSTNVDLIAGSLLAQLSLT